MIKKPWFKAKYYGWGWYPVSWQGFVVLAIWVALIVILLVNFSKYSQSFSELIFGFYLPIVLLFILMIFIGFGTGEQPKWRWGR